MSTHHNWSNDPPTLRTPPRPCIKSGSWAVNDHGSWVGEISRTSSGRCWSRCCQRVPGQVRRPSGLGGIRFRVRTGVPWRDVPVEYGPWNRVYGLFRRWQRNGT
ncbi:transposase [Streptomyces sp. NPDC001515]